MVKRGYFQDRDGGAPYTDLACERRRADTECRGVEYSKEAATVGFWERIRISSEEGARSIGRPMGLYDTLTAGRLDMLDEDAVADASDEIAKELCCLCDEDDIVPERLLIVGLGNPRLTPDAVGCESAKRVRATMHIKEFDKRFFGLLECSEIAVVTPGVRSFSGMDAADVVRGLCEVCRYDAIIAIDALASRSTERLGTTLQLSNTGIHPGCGVGNAARPITKESVGVPVIAIGVPTVIDSRMFYLDAAGIDPERADGTKMGAAMMVSPKEICEIVDSAARIISGGINQAFGLYS